MGDLTMFDSIDLSQIPADAAIIAGYTGGRWPTAREIPQRFPHARMLTIAISASEDADCLDIEQGDATPGQAVGWYARQRARGLARPCLYASASVMQASVVPAIEAAGITRPAVRLWSAHYTMSPHICGPASCREMSITADGTQYSDRAMGRDLDVSLLAADFFAVPAPPAKPPTVPSSLHVTLTLPELAQGADDKHLPHEYVRRAQLIASGVFGIALVPDGVFGPATEAALARLQAGAKLPQTGHLDAATWSLLLAGVKP